MLVEKPATRLKILLVAFGQGHFLAACEALRVGDHFGSGPLRTNKLFVVGAGGWRGMFPRRLPRRLRFTTGAYQFGVIYVRRAASLSVSTSAPGPKGRRGRYQVDGSTVSAVYRPYRWNFRNSLQSIATRHCKSLAQSFARDWFGARMRDQAPGAGGEDSKVHGISSSIRDCGWPSAIASRVAFIQV